jgi:dihydrofolate reductase
VGKLVVSEFVTLDGVFEDPGGEYVVSSSLREPAWKNSSVLEPGELDVRVTELKQELTGDLLVAGSGQLVTALTERGLVDEYRLMVYPIVLGRGERLFDGLDAPVALDLAATRPAGETLILTYVPARERVA